MSPRVSLFPLQDFKCTTSHLALLLLFMNSGPRDCGTGILPVELSSHPRVLFLSHILFLSLYPFASTAVGQGFSPAKIN